jgi:hypothetical protein
MTEIQYYDDELTEIEGEIAKNIAALSKASAKLKPEVGSIVLERAVVVFISGALSLCLSLSV